MSFPEYINLIWKNKKDCRVIFSNIALLESKYYINRVHLKYISKSDWDWNDPAYSALEYAIITPEKARPEKIKIKLQNLLKRFN